MAARGADEPVDPFGDGLVPELGVLRFEHPVSFLGEVEHAAGNVEPLQGGEELEAFADIETVVELAVDDQGWSFEVGRGEGGRPAAIQVGIGPRRSLEFPLIEPEFLGGAERTRAADR